MRSVRGPDRERLPGQPLPAGRRLEPVEAWSPVISSSDPWPSTAMAACRISTRACGEMPRRVSVLSRSSLARLVRSAMSWTGGLTQFALLRAAGDLLLDEQV